MGGPSRRSGGDTRNRRCAAASSVIFVWTYQRGRRSPRSNKLRPSTYRAGGVYAHEFHLSVFSGLRELRADGSCFEIVFFEQCGKNCVHPVERECCGTSQTLRYLAQMLKSGSDCTTEEGDLLLQEHLYCVVASCAYHPHAVAWIVLRGFVRTFACPSSADLKKQGKRRVIYISVELVESE